MKQKQQSLHIISFDSSDLASVQHLQHSAEAVANCIHNNISAIIVCGSFASSHTEILCLAHKAISQSNEEIQSSLTSLIQKHRSALDHIIEFQGASIDNIDSLMSKSDSNYYHSIISQIDEIALHTQSLFKGISYIKEISVQTSRLLCSYTSQLAALLIQANIYFAYKQIFLIVDSTDKIEYSLDSLQSIQYYIVSSLDNGSTDNETTQDYIAAQLAITHNAERLNIWTHYAGIMTANPKIIPNARPIEFIDFYLGLEIAYLGGKLLHPTAINMLLEKNIPISIYSYNNSKKATSTIAHLPHSVSNKDAGTVVAKPSTDIGCLTITDRDNFTMLSIRSTKMFDSFGYLEKVFKIFNVFHIPVETLTTSEISITITFPMNHFSEALLQDLASLGEVEYLHNQSIVSLVGNHHWKSSTHLADIFASISEKIPLHMLSLGKSASNLSIVINTADKTHILKELHYHFFEK